MDHFKIYQLNLKSIAALITFIREGFQSFEHSGEAVRIMTEAIDLYNVVECLSPDDMTAEDVSEMDRHIGTFLRRSYAALGDLL